MSGFDLILSSICINATLCTFIPPTYETPKKWERVNQLAADLDGRLLRIGTVQNYPLSYAEKDENGTLVGKGVAFEIVNLLQEKYKFSYEVILPNENLEGSNNSLQNSLLELVMNNKADLAAAFLPSLASNTDLVKYSTSLDEGEWVILMKRPRESAGGSGLLAPFDSNVWYLILVAVSSFGPFIYLMTWLRYLMTKDDKNKPYTLSPCVWFVYGALIKQGSTLSPDANTTRILFATWWIFITLLSAFYTANLTAFLTLSRFTLSINDPKDLYKKNNKWVARKGSAVEYVVTNPMEDLYYLNKMVMKSRGVFQPNPKDAEFLPYVQDDYVYVRDKPAVEHLMYDDYKNKTKQDVEEKNRCTYVITSKSFMKKPRAFAYPLNSSLYQLFDPVILSLMEAGIVKYKMRYDLPGNEICPLNLKSKERKLRNSDLSMTYMLAGAGLILAAVALITEITFLYWNKLCNFPCLRLNDTNKTNVIKVQQQKIPSGPPPYQSIFKNRFQSDSERPTQQFNGRDYWVVETRDGNKQLIPTRTPSAYLFQYTN